MESQDTVQPPITIGIPLGPSKDYCTHLILWALEQLDYGNKEIVFAVTWNEHPEYQSYYDKLEKLVKLTRLTCPVKVLKTPLTVKEIGKPYKAILANRAAIRGVFLDGDGEYLMIVGGDNPPLRDAVKRLMALDADIAFGVSNQRPKEITGGKPYPMLWFPGWTMDEVDQHDLPVGLHKAFQKAFQNHCVNLPMYLKQGHKDGDVVWGVMGGDGNALYKRCVIEDIGWTLHDYNYVSEDILLMTRALSMGYTTACDTGYHVPHIHEADGKTY